MKACTISISNKQKSWPMWHVSNINNACPFFFCWKLLRTIATHWPCLFQGSNPVNENVDQQQIHDGMWHNTAVLHTHVIILPWPPPCLPLTLHKYSLAYNKEASNASNGMKHRIWNKLEKKRKYIYFYGKLTSFKGSTYMYITMAPIGIPLY